MCVVAKCAMDAFMEKLWIFLCYTCEFITRNAFQNFTRDTHIKDLGTHSMNDLWAQNSSPVKNMCCCRMKTDDPIRLHWICYCNDI